MSTVAPVLWPCDISGAENLNVGSKFRLKCSGNLDVNLGKDLQLQFPEGVNKRSLKILEVTEQTPRSIDLVVTSYVAGENKLKFVRITDGMSAIESNELQWKVTSVLEQDAKPNPPFGFFKLSFPEVLVWSGVIAVVLLAGGLSALFYKRHQKSLLNKELDEHRSNLVPKAHFEKRMRVLRRSMNWSEVLKPEDASTKIQELDEALRVLLMQLFKVRTLKVSTKSLKTLVLENSPETDARSWTSLLQELQRRKVSDKQSVIQLMDITQKLVSRL